MGRGSRHDDGAAVARIGNEQIRGSLRRSAEPQRDPSWTPTITRKAEELAIAFGYDSDGTLRKGEKIGVLELAIERELDRMPPQVAERARRIQRQQIQGETFVPLRLVKLTSYKRAGEPGRVCHLRDAVTVRIGRYEFDVPVVATVMRRMLVVWSSSAQRVIERDTPIELERGVIVQAP